MRIKSVKKEETVYFNNAERKLCKFCGYPDKFCKHTIEKEYKDGCRHIETPLDEKSVWQLVRSHAILNTEKINLEKSYSELYYENNQLKIKNNKLTQFREMISEMLIDKMVDIKNIIRG